MDGKLMMRDILARARGENRGGPLLFLLLCWGLLVGLALLLRPLMPIDETRYTTVAWEMWQSGSFLVPQLHGLPYSDKPPLLFWLIHFGWWLFGVNDWWPRLVPPIFGLANLFLTAALARRLWPERPTLASIADVGARAPVVLLGLALWTVFTTLLMFDMLVAFCDLLALLGMLAAWRAGRDRPGRGLAGWALAGTALGLGLLAKGPVALLVPLSVALLAPWWGRTASRSGTAWAAWYGGLLAAVALAAGIALAWALPAARAGGPSYAEAILLTQTGERIAYSFAHRRAWWWYLPLLPAMLLPYSLWPGLWRAVWRLRRGPADLGLRFCLAWMIPPLLVLSSVSGKQPHYLLPLLPGFALLIARLLPEGQARRRDLLPALGLLLLLGAVLSVTPLLDGRFGLPVWADDVRPLAGVVLLLSAPLLFLPLMRRPAPGRAAAQLPVVFALSSLCVVIAVHAAFVEVARREYDVEPTALYLRTVQDLGYPIAHAGPYHGQFGFLGRLRQPIAQITAGESEAWLRRHPDGKVVAQRRHIPPHRLLFDYVQPYRDDFLAVWGSAPGTRSAPSG